MRKAEQIKGIFCLEGNWDKDLSKGSTIQPLLELLRANEGIPYIHRDCATCSEFAFYLSKWPQKRYAMFPILYVALHGEKSGIQLEDGFYDLDKIGQIIGDNAYNRIALFSSCGTMDIDKRNLKRFLRKTNCLAVCGYRAEIDWMRSAAFDLLLLYEIQANEFSGRGIEAIQKKALQQAQSFPDLQFRMVSIKDSA